MRARFDVYEQLLIYSTLEEVGNNHEAFAQLLFEISKQFKKMDLLLIQAVLRELGSEIYLIAVPINTIQKGFVSTWPHTDTIYPYFLKVAVLPKEYIVSFLSEHNLTEAENSERLAQTGLPMQRRMIKN